MDGGTNTLSPCGVDCVGWWVGFAALSRSGVAARGARRRGGRGGDSEVAAAAGSGVDTSRAHASVGERVRVWLPCARAGTARMEGMGPRGCCRAAQMWGYRLLAVARV